MHWMNRGAILLLVVLLCGLLSQTGFFRHQSEQMLDILFTLRGERPASQDIVIVGIDEESIREFGAWPFPRSNYLALIDRLREAKVVGFDLIFTRNLENMELFTHKGVFMVMAVAPSYDEEMLEPEISDNPWISLGHIATQLSGSGIVRRIRLMDKGFPSFALSMKESGEAEWSPLIGYGDTAGRLINFYGPEFTFTYVSYKDVVRGRYPPGFFANQYVLVGAVAVGMGDVQLAPFSKKYLLPGVEIQATILNNLLDSNFLRVLPVWTQYLLAFSLLAILLFLFPYYSPLGNLLRVCCAVTFLVLLSYVLFFFNFFFDPFLPSFVIITGYFSYAIMEFMLVTKGVTKEIKALNEKLEKNTKDFFYTVPYLLRPSVSTEYNDPLKSIHFGEFSGYLKNINRKIYTLSLQNSFVQHLMSFEVLPLVVWAVDDGQIVVANSGFSLFWKELNLSDDLPDLTMFFKLLQEKAVDQKFRKECDLSLFVNESFPQEEIVCDTVLRLQGRRRYLRAIVRRITSPEFEFEGIIASLIDVTGIRELERRKSELVDIVSHELKLPLTTIMGYGDLLAMSLGGEEKVYAQKVFNEAQRLSGMITDFLNIARIEKEENMMSRLPFDLLEVINDAILAVHFTKEKGVYIESDLPARVSPLIGDSVLMTQVLINLLDNAVKYNSAGSVVRLKLVEQETAFHLFVIDSGKGVSDAEKLEIFKKFHKGVDEKESVGFGLGLNFVLKVVEAHGGSIFVEDAVGGGAIFHIILPRS